MDDGPRNERARQKHRQLLKEVCGCTSVPSTVVIGEGSSSTLGRQELGEEKNFGWKVYERANADEEYGKLRHQESFRPVKESYGSQKGPRSLKPELTSSYLTGSNQTVDKAPIYQTQYGPRNEIARLRHREMRKEICGCSSIVSKVSSEELPRLELNEENHFGWAVVRKAYGDPEFERLMQFHEKPDITSNDFQKKTYVLYMQEGTVVDRESFLKGKKARLPIGDLITEPTPDKTGKTREPTHTGKKKNLISELFFLPAKERSRSRSPKAGQSKQKLLGQLTDYPLVPVSEDNKYAGDISKKSSQEKFIVKNDIDNNSKKRGSLRRYLRAGGENSKKSITGCETGSVLSNVPGVVNYGSKFVKRKDANTSKRVTSNEYLLDTPSGTNEYLYVSRRSFENRQKPK